MTKNEFKTALAALVSEGTPDDFEGWDSGNTDGMWGFLERHELFGQVRFINTPPQWHKVFFFGCDDGWWLSYYTTEYDQEDGETDLWSAELEDAPKDWQKNAVTAAEERVAEISGEKKPSRFLGIGCNQGVVDSIGVPEGSLPDCMAAFNLDGYADPEAMGDTWIRIYDTNTGELVASYDGSARAWDV
jgi:hypothetical protein